MKKIIVLIFIMLLIPICLTGCNSENKVKNDELSSIEFFSNSENVEYYIFLYMGNTNDLKIEYIEPKRLIFKDDIILYKGNEYYYKDNCLCDIRDDKIISPIYLYLTTIYTENQQ